MHAAFLALAFVIGGAALAAAATDEELRQQILGKWGENPACQSTVLVFSADGTFTSDNLDDDPDNDIRGTFQIAGGKLTGKAGDEAMPEVTLRFDASTLYFESDGDVTDTLIRCAE